MRQCYFSPIVGIEGYLQWYRIGVVGPSLRGWWLPHLSSGNALVIYPVMWPGTLCARTTLYCNVYSTVLADCRCAMCQLLFRFFLFVINTWELHRWFSLGFHFLHIFPFRYGLWSFLCLMLTSGIHRILATQPLAWSSKGEGYIRG